jgi:hypothetical protein
LPNYLVSAAPGRVVLRNFEGAMFSYSEPGTDSSGEQAQWVSDLAHGKSQRILPEGQQHYLRRQDRVASGRAKKKGSNGSAK